jgi:hypothetical protein
LRIFLEINNPVKDLNDLKNIISIEMIIFEKVRLHLNPDSDLELFKKISKRTKNLDIIFLECEYC